MQMVRLLIPFTVAAAVLALSGCQSGPKVSPFDSVERMVESDPAKPYLGMSKAEVIACAGSPASTYGTKTGETLVFRYSGAGPVPGQKPDKAKEEEDKGGSPLSRKKSDKGWTCSASLVFEGGKLSRVTFAHKDAVSPYEQKKNAKTGEKTYVTPPPPCAFSLPSCPRG